MEREKDICMGCDHFCLNNDDDFGIGCRAFPDGEDGGNGIPSIIGELHSHDKPFKGKGWHLPQENDYVYTPAKRKINHYKNEIEIYQDSNPYADENGRYNGK